MPLPEELKEKIKANIEEAEARVKSTEDVIEDLRRSGIDASKQEERLRETKESLRTLRLFYDRQSAKPAE